MHIYECDGGFDILAMKDAGTLDPIIHWSYYKFRDPCKVTDCLVKSMCHTACDDKLKYIKWATYKWSIKFLIKKDLKKLMTLLGVLLEYLAILIGAIAGTAVLVIVVGCVYYLVDCLLKG